MKSMVKEEIYRLLEGLLVAIKSGDFDALSVYEINEAIYEEITDELARSRENVEGLQVPPYSIAFQTDSTGRIPFDIVESNSESEIGRVYCQLWNATEKSDLTLVADVRREANTPTLAFRLLETQ